MKGLKQQSLEVKKEQKNPQKSQAKLLLVGAGPGDPELLTIKALKALKSADIILYDNLVNKEIFTLFPHENKDFLYVGKKCSEKHISQDEIHDLILKNLYLGKKVLRLKGGDPFIFARGVEEMQIAQSKGFDVEIIPGLTSGLAVPALNGIPLTLREKSDTVLLVTGHVISEDKVKDWAFYLNSGATLVVYMGLHSIGKIQEYLLLNKISDKLPVIAIQEGSLSSQTLIKTNLRTISHEVAANQLKSPTIFVFGENIIV